MSFLFWYRLLVSTESQLGWQCQMASVWRLTFATGGGIQASGDTPKQEENGRAIVIGGLFIQTIVFSMFLVVTGLFHCRIVRRPTGRSEILQVPWLQYINVLYVVSVLIMVRSIFRVAEYIQGRDGELMTREFYFYILDTALMFIMSAIFNYFHPTSIIPQRRKDDLELDSMERLDSRTGTGIQET